MVRLHTNVWESLKLLEKFIFTEWKFHNKGTIILSNSLSAADKQLFNIDIGTLKWDECKRLRTYLSKIFSYIINLFLCLRFHSSCTRSTNLFEQRTHENTCRWQKETKNLADPPYLVASWNSFRYLEVGCLHSRHHNDEMCLGRSIVLCSIRNLLNLNQKLPRFSNGGLNNFNVKKYVSGEVESQTQFSDKY